MIIDGKTHSEKLRKKIKDELTKICQNTKDVPKLSVILIGDYLPSQIYVKNKQKKAKEVGINSEVIKYPETVSEKEVLDKIKSLNNDKEVNGILVQLPLPKQINQKKIINSIDPKKDVDGFNPLNVGNLASGSDSVIPCTPLGCLFLIKSVEKN